MKRLLLPCFAVIAALGISAAAHAADVGRVLLAAGDTVAIRGTQTVRLTFGTLIQDKDLLRTGAASNLQVRFIDESIVSMKEASELRIDEFQFSGKEDGKERGFFSLLKGGLRTVTGLVGRSNNANYRLSTITAAVGIRGTDYAATLCQGDCRNNDGSLAKDGLYGRTHGMSHGTNRIEVSNERDQKTFGINENFYVADARSVVQPLLVAPDFVSSKLEGRKQGGAASSGTGSGSEQATTGGAAAESRPSTTPEPLPQLQFVATQNLGPEGTPVVVVAVLPHEASKQYQFVFTNTPSSIGSGSQGATPTFTFSGPLLTSYNTPSPSGPQSGNLLTGTIVESTPAASPTIQAAAAAAGNIQWGRWTGTFQVINGGQTLTPGSGLHYSYGDVAGTLPTTGSATYNYIGGTNPTNSSGGVGAFTGGAFNVNFVTRTLTIAAPLTFTMPGNLSYSLTTCTSCTYSSPTASFINNPATLSGLCTGGSCLLGSGATGILYGGFTGATGQGLVTSSGISTAGGVAPVATFTAAFVR